MNYKITAGILGVLLIGTYAFFWNSFFNQKTNHLAAPSAHQMSDGTMMSNTHSTTSTPMNMDSMMKDMMSALDGKTGDAFDKAFLSEMIVHHAGAVEMAQAVVKTSKRPELLKLANDIILAQNKEIDMMKTWQKNWFMQ